MRKPASKRWMGTPPTNCQICGDFLILSKGHVYFVDFKTRENIWVIGCLKCFEKLCGRLGKGFGQKYRLGDMTKVS